MKFRQLEGKRAFSLIELILVVVIIAILAGITIPNYTKAKERALCKDASANLNIIAAAEKIRHIEQDGYVACGCYCTGTGLSPTCCDNMAAGCNKLLKLSLNPESWTYSVGLSATNGFVAVATRRSGTCQYRITANDSEPSAVSGTGCP